MSGNIIDHYNQHKVLGTASTKDGLPIQLPVLSQADIDLLDDLEAPDGGDYLQAGMIVYNSDTNTIQFHNGTDWVVLATV